MPAIAARMAGVGDSPIMGLIKRLAAAEVKPISFASGLPDASLFPRGRLAAIAGKVIGGEPGSLQYSGADGLPSLRARIAGILRARGFDGASAEAVVVTTGSQQALDLAARALLDPRDVVAVESPTYLAALQVFDAAEARFVPLDLDSLAEGTSEDAARAAVDAQLAKHKPKAVYLMSNFANPTGASLPAAVRRAVRTACTDRDVWLLEDDAYHELALDGPAGTPACAYPGGLGAVYTSTFSKSIAPGLRVGYLYSPDHELVRRIGQLKQVTDLHASTLAQRMVEEYLDDPGSEADIAAIRNAYRSRRDAMLEALDKELGAMERAGRVRWTRPGGGMFIFVDLPEEVGGEQLLDACWDQGLAFVPGDTFFADTGTGPARKNTIRLNFVSEGEDRIREGVAILARVLKGMAEANGTA